MTKDKTTKADIIQQIHTETGIHRGDIHQVIDNLFDVLKEGLAEDKVIELRGFGTFAIRTRKGREKARNPKTGDIVSVETHGVAVFRPGKELKENCWGVEE